MIRRGFVLRSSCVLHRMSSVAYVVPFDIREPNPCSIPNLDPPKLWSSTPTGEKEPKVGTTRIFYNTPASAEGLNITALSALGEKFSTMKGDARRERVRRAIGSAVRDVKGVSDGIKDIIVDGSADPHASAVAAMLAQYKFTLKTSPPSPFNPYIKEPQALPPSLNIKPLIESKYWDCGIVYAQAQNFARTLMELPANMMTPTVFTDYVKSKFAGVPNVEIIIHDAAWAAEKGMRTFLSVAKGSSEPAKFMEIHYNGTAKDVQPLAFVGKGITFDTGGISLKPPAGMKQMRADMGGAAAVVSATLAIAQLKIPVNLVTITPLTENMPGPSASKPGDIVYAMNGKSVEIDNTDAEGRLVLSDALYYASSVYKPHTLIDVATLTGAIGVALGEVYAGVYSTSDTLWEQLRVAGECEYDRFWRMPLEDDYGPQIHSSNADLCNTGGKPAGSCTAALFLKAFVDGLETGDGQTASINWAHIDIAGTMEATRKTPYLEKGLTGRPTRALIEFVRRLVEE